MAATGAAVRELWRYRELFYFMVWRDIKVRYKQSVLGALWAVIQPFATMIVFTLIFHKAGRIPSSSPDVPYSIFSYSALLPWTYFAAAIQQSGQSLVLNSDLLTKVYFPRVIIPWSSVVRGLLDFAVASVLLVGMMFYYEIMPQAKFLLLPVLVVPLVTLALGVGMIFAALNVRFRDVQHVLPFVVQLWLFVTPIIYPSDEIPDRWQGLLALNPLTGIVESFRACVLPATQFNFVQLGSSCAIAAVIFVFGAWYFRRTARSFADVI